MLRLTIRRPGSLESVLLDIEISKDEAASIEDMFRARDQHTGLVIGDTVRMSQIAPAWRDDLGVVVDFAGPWAHVRFTRSPHTVARVRAANLVLVERTKRLVNGLYKLVPLGNERDHEMMIGRDTAD